MPEKNTATKLLRAVIAKSFIELIFVCIVATAAAFSNFSPLLRGAIDIADQSRVSGWAHDPLAPHDIIEVQLFIDGEFAAGAVAGLRRDDLVKAAVTADPNHGFDFELGPLSLKDGNHSAQVYAVRKTAGSIKALIPIARSALEFQVSRNAK